MDQRKGQAAGGGLVMYEELMDYIMAYQDILTMANRVIEIWKKEYLKVSNELEQVKAERETYKMFFDDVTGKPDCNDCGRFECEYKPKVGETTRFNCPLWRGMQGGKDD